MCSVGGDPNFMQKIRKIGGFVGQGEEAEQV